ncbi:hypothetical protein F4806DRAFT_503186 [Annulohypoxylon nitens]|nr:hypothetical protein F4806DRAFT_503186 [Annulohypoxylon nitens]
MDLLARSLPAIERGCGLVIVSWILGGIGCVLLILRLYTRAAILRRTGLDDWSMLIAVILAIGSNIVTTLMVHWGVGKHSITLEEGDRVKAVCMIWLNVFFAPGCTSFGKSSIALFLMNLIHYQRLQRSFLWVLIALLITTYLILIIIAFAQCTPVTYLWERFMAGTHGTCWPATIVQYYAYFQSGFSACSDLVLALYPIGLIWNMHLSKVTKFGIVCLMSLGIIAAGAGGVKTAELKHLASPDFTWDTVPLVYWIIAENWIIIICACVPTTKPFFNNGEWRLKNIYNRLTKKCIRSLPPTFHNRSEHPSYRLDSLDQSLYERPFRSFKQQGVAGCRDATTSSVS